MSQETAQLISTVGFPIAAFLLMFWFATRALKENTNAIIDIKEAMIKLYEIYRK